MFPNLRALPEDNVSSYLLLEYQEVGSAPVVMGVNA